MIAPPVLSIGNLGLRQCAMREDGQWFVRVKRENRPGWGPWLPVPGRPAHAWFNSNNGHARLPDGTK